MSSSKDKRYTQQVEKAIASFDQLEEWADYIAFLSRLHKALQLTPPSWIPVPHQVSTKLAACLSSRLPNGVHQKALSLYEAVFGVLSNETLAAQISIWLPGLLPLFSYCLIQVKPQLIKLYKHLIERLPSSSLKLVAKPLISSLLPGLDDENSEAFQDTFAIVDLLKRNLNHDSHFWRLVFLCIIENPERRLGALAWCNKRLPTFQTFKVDDCENFSEEASACLSPEPGLMVRAFATAINSSTLFNPASDIIVVRGFFDLLLSHVPLGSYVVNQKLAPADKQLLIMSCVRVTLKKDMSLNRRLWNWLLGDSETSTARLDYFRTHGLDALCRGILDLTRLSGPDIITAIRISHALIMDKWELSAAIAPRVFAPILLTCYETGSPDVIAAVRTLLDTVEAPVIWGNVFDLIQNDNLLVVKFLLKNFNFHEDDMITSHVPLAILVLLTKPCSDDWLSVLRLLVSIASSNFALVEPTDPISSDEIIPLVETYYKKLVEDDSVEFPEPMARVVGTSIHLLCQRFESDLSLDSLCSLLCDFLYNTPADVSVVNSSLVAAILAQPLSSYSDNIDEKQARLVAAINTTKLLGHLLRNTTPEQKSRLLKVILTNLWIPAMLSSSPANHQVEAVKHIFDLMVLFPAEHVEAGVLTLLLESPINLRVRAFSVLWSHSAAFTDADRILSRPLHVILDDIDDLHVVEFVKSVSKSGTTNRLLKLITNQLLNFDIVKHSKSNVDEDDDLTRFSYHLSTVLNVLSANEKPLREAFSSELAVIDNNDKIHIIRENQWEISSYKSLLLRIVEKLITTTVDTSSPAVMNSFRDTITTSLKLLSRLVTGNEPDFSDKLHLLIESCTHYINLDDRAADVELIERAFLAAILELLAISDHLRINLNLLHIDDEGKEPLLVRLIIQGISKAQSSLLLETWFVLLTNSLYLFNESVFSVILPLSDAIIAKVAETFDRIRSFEVFNEVSDVESSLNILIAGLEDLLSISHSYLLPGRVNRPSVDLPNKPLENGFFGNVIQGVFQIESPAIRTSEQNKLYSILLSFQDAVRIAFIIWKWADSRPQAVNKFASERSLIHFSNKLKFRSRKLLEALVELERQEVVETLISIDAQPEVIKVLHVLDGGRSQVTLPHVIRAIVSRAYPQLLDEKDKSKLNIPLSVERLTAFLVVYIDSIDDDTITDVWDTFVGFVRDASSHASAFREAIPELLRAVKTISLKSGGRSELRNKKELADTFIKLLSTASDSEAFVDAVLSVIPSLDTIIQDLDKVTSAYGTLISGLVNPQLKQHGIDVLDKTLQLIELIGNNHSGKTWRALAYDTFSDDALFQGTGFERWINVFRLWIESDKDKFGDLIVRITPSVLLTTSNIFIWNEKSEVDSKLLIIKRIVYLLMIQPKDYFLTYLDVLMERVEYSLGISCPAAYRNELSLLFRAVTMRFSEMHLLPHWLMIINELTTVFSDLNAKAPKELQQLSADESRLVLLSCKLLDQLLIMRFDEFSLNSWIFVASELDTSSGTNDSSSAVIDQISLTVNQLPTKEPPVKVHQPNGPLEPLLKDVGSISSISQLRTFFDSLSLISYERVFGLYEVNSAACDAAIVADLQK